MFLEQSAPGKALLMFRAVKMPCVHTARFPSFTAHVLLLAFTRLGKTSAWSVVHSWECDCKTAREEGGDVGSHRGHLPGDTVKLTCCGVMGVGDRRAAQPARGMCSVSSAVMLKPFIFI